MFKMAFQSLVSEGHSPSKLLTLLNRQFVNIIPEDDFLTVFYGVIDPAAMRLTYSNAGHPKPLLCKARGREIVELGTGGTIIGAFPGMHFEEAHEDLEPCDRLLVYTDGLTETCSDRSRFDFYGESRLKEVFRSSSYLDETTVLRRILDDVTAFHGNAQGDSVLACLGKDATCLVNFLDIRLRVGYIRSLRTLHSEGNSIEPIQSPRPARRPA